MAFDLEHWKREQAKRDQLWHEKINHSQTLPKRVCVGKVFTLTVADGKVLYEVVGSRRNTCKVALVDGGPDHYCDAVLGAGGWFPVRAIEPLVLREHAMAELFGR